MKTLFISYRRSDTLEETNLLKKKLVDWFGNELVFRDEEAIPFGFDFRDVIKESIAESVAVLVVIGDRWFDPVDESGRRLDQEDDPVRVEVELALKSKAPVIPVLVRGVKVPALDQLPESLRGLKYRNAAILDPQADGDAGLEQLHEDLSAFVYTAAGPAGGTSRRDAAGRYLPGGVWFEESGDDWLLGARMDKQPLEFRPWPVVLWSVIFLHVIYCSIGSAFLLLGHYIESFSLYFFPFRIDDGRIVFYFESPEFESSLIALLSSIPFLVGLFLAKRFRRTYHAFLLNHYGKTIISLRGDTIRVWEGVPLFSRSIEVKVASIESVETREDGFGLVVDRGRLLHFVECFEFGKRLSIMKRLFMARALAKLLGSHKEADLGNPSAG